MKYITHIIRFLVGVLFIISGLIKLNDPLGFSYKLEEYFSEQVLNIPFLIPFALAIATFLVIFEVVLGIFLLLGYLKRFTLFNLLWMIVFFTFLTFYSAYFDKVKDCGCFGDVLKLTPWESFTKDVVLLILILILLVGKQHIKPLFSFKINTILGGLATVFCFYMAYDILTYLPWQDFRAYSIGSDWIEGKKSAEELGLSSPVYETYYELINPENKEKIIVTGTEYANNYDKYKDYTLTQNTTTKLIKEGYVSKMQDLDIIDKNGESIFNDLMLLPKKVFFISKELDKAKNLEGLKKWIGPFKAKGYKVFLITSELDEENLWTETPILYSDKTVLKTIVRANPGIVVLHQSKVIEKWNANQESQIKSFLD